MAAVLTDSLRTTQSSPERTTQSPSGRSQSARGPAWVCTNGRSNRARLLSLSDNERPQPDSNSSARKKLWIVAGLSVLFMAGEVTGGLLANSLAILTDAAHLLSDLASFLISLAALYLATRSPTSQLSFGFHRAEILGALVSVLIIWLLTGVLVYEAVLRIRSPEDVDGMVMFIVAAGGLAVNCLMGVVLHHSGHSHSHGLGGGGGHGHSHGNSGHAADPRTHTHAHGLEGLPLTAVHVSVAGRPPADFGEHEPDQRAGRDGESKEDVGSTVATAQGLPDRSSFEESKAAERDESDRKEDNINVRAAFIHVLGDGVQSCGVMIAAIIIWVKPEWRIADPICTFLFSVLVLFITTRVFKQIVGVLMEGVPQGIDPADVEKSLRQVSGVTEVHDLHIWSLSVGKACLSVHLLLDHESHSALKDAHTVLARRHNIYHSTIQIESHTNGMDCWPLQ